MRQGPEHSGVIYRRPSRRRLVRPTVAAVGDINGAILADIGSARRERTTAASCAFIKTRAAVRSWRTDATIVARRTTPASGEAIAGGGDVDGDGVGDMVIGEPGWDGGLTDEGRFGLIYGPIVVHDLVPATFVESNILGATLGASIAPFRDINLDGFADVMVGAPGVAGRVYPFMGGGGFGKRLDIQPVDYGGSNLRALHPARSHDPDQVAAFFIQNTAAQGRTRLGYEIEIKPTSEPFDGVPASWIDHVRVRSGGSQTPAFTISFLSPQLPGRTLKMRGRWTTPNPLFPRSRWGTPEAHTAGSDVWLKALPSACLRPVRLRVRWIKRWRRILRSVPAGLVSFTLPRAGRIALYVFDLRGARVRRMLAEARSAGPSSIAWDGKDDNGRVAAAGIYMMVLRSGDEVARAKIIRLP